MLRITPSILLFLFSVFCLRAQDTASVIIEGRKMWGYKDSTGTMVIPARYQQVNPFREGFASVKLHNRWGFINKAGKEITPFKYDCMYDNGKDYSHFAFSESLAAVSVERKWGYVNGAGREVIPLIFESADWFRDGSAVVRNTQRTLLIDKTGRSMLTRPYDHFFHFSYGFDLAVVGLNKKYGFIDRKGREVVPLKYDYADDFEGGFAVVRSGDKETIIDLKGKEVIPFRYGKILGFSDSLAMVREYAGGPCGFINGKGELAIPIEYEDGFSFEKGRALVRKGGLWGIIDRDNSPITPFKYEDEGIDHIFLFEQFWEGIIALMYKGKFGYVNVITGKEFTPFKYERAGSFNKYECCAEAMYKGVWWKIDKDGKEHKMPQP